MLNIICALYSQQTYNAVLLGRGGRTQCSLSCFSFLLSQRWSAEIQSGQLARFSAQLRINTGGDCMFPLTVYYFQGTSAGCHLSQPCVTSETGICTLPLPMTTWRLRGPGDWLRVKGLKHHRAGMGQNTFLLSPGQCFLYSKSAREARK